MYFCGVACSYSTVTCSLIETWQLASQSDPDNFRSPADMTSLIPGHEEHSTAAVVANMPKLHAVAYPVHDKHIIMWSQL